MPQNSIAAVRIRKTPRPAPALSRVERKKRDKLERIKRAARALFARKGFEATTTREIARLADVGVGTVFLHAVSKQDLLVMIFREEAGLAVDTAFATMGTRPLLDSLLRIFNALIDHHERNLGLARVFVKEMAFVDDARHGRAAFMSDLYKRMAAMVDRAKERGELRGDVPSHRLAKNLFAIYFSILQEWLGTAGLDPEDRDRSLRAALELQLAGLRPQGDN